MVVPIVYYTSSTTTIITTTLSLPNPKRPCRNFLIALDQEGS